MIHPTTARYGWVFRPFLRGELDADLHLSGCLGAVAPEFLKPCGVRRTWNTPGTSHLPCVLSIYEMRSNKLLVPREKCVYLSSLLYS